MEVESKFNPDDWNGYLHTYETIEEYNAAKKLLPHTARIESTKEAKYISREELPTRFLYIGNINRSSMESIRDNHDFDDYLDYMLDNSTQTSVYEEAGWEYILIGKIEYSGENCYLWELTEFDSSGCSGEQINRRYALTKVVEPKYYYSNVGNVYRAKLLTEDTFTEYSRMHESKENDWNPTIDGHYISEVIFCISDYALS